MKKHKIAIMGFGTVGGGTYDILTQNRDHIRSTQGVDIEVKYVLDRSAESLEKRGADKSLFCSDVDALAADKEVELVVETMGGVEPAKTFITKMLRAGK